MGEHRMRSGWMVGYSEVTVAVNLPGTRLESCRSYRILVRTGENWCSQAQNSRLAGFHERTFALVCSRTPGTFQAGVRSSWRPLVPARDVMPALSRHTTVCRATRSTTRTV